jgi:uncharacterized membrane protein YbhN (UPF0104 family)
MNWQRLLAVAQHLREQRWIRLAVNGLFVGGAVIFIGWYLVRDWQEVVRQGLSLDAPQLGGAFLLYGVNFFLLALVWQGIVVRLGGPASWAQNAQLYANTFVTRFLPTPLWFLGSRVVLYGRTGVRRRMALTMTASETLLHMLAGAALLGVVSVDLRRPLTGLCVLALAPIVVVLVRPEWLELRWLNLGQVTPGIRRKDVALWLSVYLLTWIVAGPFLSCVVQAFTRVPPPPLLDLWRMWALAGVATYITNYLLGGIGVFQELTLGWMLTRMYPLATAVVIAIGSRLVITLSGIVWSLGLISVTNLVRKNLPSRDSIEGEE